MCVVTLPTIFTVGYPLIYGQILLIKKERDVSIEKEIKRERKKGRKKRQKKERKRDVIKCKEMSLLEPI